MRTWPKLAAVPTTLVTAALVFSGVAAGNTTDVTEADEAGDLPATAQHLGDAPASVIGALQERGDVDLYRFCTGDQGFTLSTVNGETTIDTQLAVFHGDGTALGFNDDSGDPNGTRQARLHYAPGAVPAGEYLVAVNTFGAMAQNAQGQDLFVYSQRKQQPPAWYLEDDRLLASWARASSGVGAYRIDLVGTTPCAAAPVGPADVGLDVKPGSDDNPINLRARGRTPIALLGSADLDVRTIALETFLAGPGEAPLTGSPSFEDVDGDGHADLVGHVETQTLGLTEGDTEVCVDAEAAGGAVRGCDAIQTR